MGGHARPAVWDLDPGIELREPRSCSVVPGRGARHRKDCARHMPALTSPLVRVGRKGGSSIGGFGMLLYYNNIWKAPATARVRVASDAPICVWYSYGIRIRYSI